MNLVELLETLRRVRTVLELEDNGRLVTLGRRPDLDFDEHWAMLTDVVLGRLTGHAPGACDRCGAVAMVGVWTRAGVRRAAPSCRLTPACEGRVLVTSADLRGVGRPGVTIPVGRCRQ